MTFATTPVLKQPHDAAAETAADAGLLPPVKRTLFGVGVSVTDYARTVRHLMAVAQAGRSAIVSFAPANIIVEGAADPAFRRKLNDFDLVCPDGQPVRWCMNYFNAAGLADRVYGPACTLLLCEAAAARGVPVYFYGASPDTLAKLVAELQRRFPDLNVAGAESPPYRPLTAEEDRAAAARINASGAGLIFLGLGSLKQEDFAWRHRQDVRGVQLCVGAAFDFIAGTKPNAPAWMQRRGLEWLYRLACEPRRLFRRYAVTNSLFVLYALRERWRRPANRAA